MIEVTGDLAAGPWSAAPTVLVSETAADRLCELNVLAQARHVADTTIAEDAWERGQQIAIHSWIYRLDTGLISTLAPPISRPFVRFDPHSREFSEENEGL